MIDDFERCYRAVAARDDRFDGWFFTAVTSTGIYCRPSCPARTPGRANVRFFATAAAAQAHGFRACRRCRPDAVPGSPQWDVRTDVAARAMRLIADGVVDREGVQGLARRLGYSTRQLQRVLTDEVGAGPLALARAQRAHTARLLIETTAMPFADVAFAAGFGSVRQFNETVRAVFAAPPTRLRRTRAPDSTGAGGVTLRLAYRHPFPPGAWQRFLATRAVAGCEVADGERYRRTLRLPHAAAVVQLSDADGWIACRLWLDDGRDLPAAVQRCRRLLDLDADPAAVTSVLASDPRLAAVVTRTPGLRVHGCVDGTELAVRAVLGQQVSVAGARTAAGRLVAALGKPLDRPGHGLTHLFPDAQTLAAVDPGDLAMPRSRARAIVALAAAVADGRLALDPGADRAETRDRLLAIRGIGPWTADYVAMRGLGDPDAFPAADLGLRRAGTALGITPAELPRAARAWRPWRSYAAGYLWSTLEGTRT